MVKEGCSLPEARPGSRYFSVSFFHTRTHTHARTNLHCPVSQPRDLADISTRLADPLVCAAMSNSTMSVCANRPDGGFVSVLGDDGQSVELTASDMPTIRAGTMGGQCSQVGE